MEFWFPGVLFLPGVGFHASLKLGPWFSGVVFWFPGVNVPWLPGGGSWLSGVGSLVPCSWLQVIIAHHELLRLVIAGEEE